MKPLSKSLGFLFLFMFFVPFAHSATVTGAVKGGVYPFTWCVSWGPCQTQQAPGAVPVFSLAAPSSPMLNQTLTVTPE